MSKIIAADEIHVDCESQVYNAVLCWVQYDHHSRQQYLKMLLEAVSIPKVSSSALRFFFGLLRGRKRLSIVPTLFFSFSGEEKTNHRTPLSTSFFLFLFCWVDHYMWLFLVQDLAGMLSILFVSFQLCLELLYGAISLRSHELHALTDTSQSYNLRIHCVLNPEETLGQQK